MIQGFVKIAKQQKKAEKEERSDLTSIHQYYASLSKKEKKRETYLY